MKYLRKHETISEFQAYSDDQIENDRPNTSYVEEQSKVYFTDKDYLKEYLTFKSLDANEIGFRFGYNVTTGNTPYIEYSVNDGEWERITNRNNAEVSDSIQVNEGDTIRWRSASKRFYGSSYYSDYYTEIYDNFSNFTTHGPFDVYGNIMSIFYGDNFDGHWSFENNTYYNAIGLFRDAEIVRAGNLICPVTTLKTASYSKMFKNCSDLIIGPQFTYSTLADDAFYEAFYGCTSLKVPPKCNFNITLRQRCYEKMFAHCTSLRTSPVLLGQTTLEHAACDGMFSGCTKLSKITCLANEIEDGVHTEKWVCGVSKTGVFIGDAHASWVTGDNGIPKGWVVKDTIAIPSFEPNHNTFCVLVDDFPDDDPSFYEIPGASTMEDVFEGISSRFETGGYNNGISEYWYSGESLEYDGQTWYVFVKDGPDVCYNKHYLLMDTNDPNELYHRSACYNEQNCYYYGYDGDGNIGIFLKPDLQETYGGPNTNRSDEIIIDVIW